MSKQVKVPQRPEPGAPMLPKSERRALGKQAAARRAVARRRRAFLRKLAPFAAVLGVVGVVVLAFVIFSGDSGTTTNTQTSTDASPTPSAEVTTPAPVPTNPPDADPALQTKPTVTKGTGTLTKLVTTTLIEGKGEAIQSGQTIAVNYVGIHFDTGEEFDSSWKSGAPTPLELPIGVGQVIQGWDQGLVGVKIGSRVQLDIPSELAYPNPQNGQPAGPLRFVVDILGAR